MGIKKVFGNKKGTAEIVGTALFLVILFFFFSNVFLFHNSVSREMDQVIADKMNSAIRMETTVGGGNPSYAFPESITHGSDQDVTFDPSVTRSPDGNSRNIIEVEVDGVNQLYVSYTFATGITSPEKMRLIAAVQINVRATFDDPAFEGCVIGIWDCIDNVVVDTGISVIKGYRWSNVTLSPAERYIDIATGNVKIGFLDSIGGVSGSIWGMGGSSQWGGEGSNPDPDPGTLRIDCMEVIPEPVALEVTNLGGLDVMLSRLWITNNTITAKPTNDHVYADLESLNIWIAAGSRQTIILSDKTEFTESIEDSIRVTNEVEGVKVHYVPPSEGSIIFKVITKNGNTAACSYTFSLIATPKPPHYIDTANQIHDTNVGSHSSFPDMKNDGSYDTLTEANTGGGSGSFGSSSSSSYTMVSADQMYGSVFTSPSNAEGATISTIVAYCRYASSSGNINVKAVLVRHSDLEILAVSNVLSVSTTASNKTFTFASPPTISANTEYVLMLIPNGNLRFYYNTGTINQGHFDTSNSYSSPTDPTDTTHNNYQYRILATYNIPNNYQLDLEVQFSGVTDYMYYTQLEIKTGTLNAENLAVYYWNGAWQLLTNALTENTMNTFTVGLTGPTFDLRFYDTSRTGDTGQGNWQIDYVRLVAP